MKIRLDIVSEEMTAREISTLSRELSAALGQFQKAESVDTVNEPAPEGAKGFVEVLGSILMGLPGDAIAEVLHIIRAIASRPGQPAFAIKITRDTTEVSFDPRKITPEEVAKLARRLRPPG